MIIYICSREVYGDHLTYQHVFGIGLETKGPKESLMEILTLGAVHRDNTWSQDELGGSSTNCVLL